VESSTIAQLVTEADVQSSFHCEFMSTSPTKRDAMMKLQRWVTAKINKNKGQMASLDGCVFYTASCLQLTSDTGLGGMLVGTGSY